MRLYQYIFNSELPKIVENTRRLIFLKRFIYYSIKLLETHRVTSIWRCCNIELGSRCLDSVVGLFGTVSRFGDAKLMGSRSPESTNPQATGDLNIIIFVGGHPKILCVFRVSRTPYWWGRTSPIKLTGVNMTEFAQISEWSFARVSQDGDFHFNWGLLCIQASK